MREQHTVDELLLAESSSTQGSLLPLDLADLRIVSQSLQSDGSIEVHVIATTDREVCPNCFFQFLPTRISNGFVEGKNNRTKALMRQGYGYRNRHHPHFEGKRYMNFQAVSPGRKRHAPQAHHSA